MDPTEWQAAAERGQIVQDEGPERDLQAVLSGRKPATDFEIHANHVLADMYESGELEDRVRAASAVIKDDRCGGVIVGHDAAAVERLGKALKRVRQGKPSLLLGRAYGYAPEDVVAFFRRQGWDYETFVQAARDEGLIADEQG